VDASGNVFVADDLHHAVKEILAAGGYTTIKTLGSGFSLPYGVAVDGSGNVFVTDQGSNAVYEILAAGGYTAVKTLGSGFNGLTFVAVDGSGNLFVGGSSNNPVTEIVAAGGYTTLQTLGSEHFFSTGVAVDGSGNVFVEDYQGGNVQEMLAAGGYTTVKVLASGFRYPTGLAVDGIGNVFLTDQGAAYPGSESGGSVLEILAAGGYTTVKTLTTDFNGPNGVALDGSGNVFFAWNSDIEKLDYADPPSVTFPTPTPVGSKDTADGAKTVSVWSSGNQPLLFTTPAAGSNPDYPEDFPKNAADTNLCAAGASLAPGVSCDVSMNFVPSATGALTESVTLTTNTLNTEATQQAIAVTGNSTSADLFLRIIPTTTTVHQGDLLTYAFPVWNLGPDNANLEVLNTQVPAGTVFDYIRISGTPGLGTCTHTPYLGARPISIVCHENGVMALNTTWTVRLTVKVTAPAGTVITESAATMAETPDPNLANNSATVSLTVVP
jgi:Domain of unknown function DUF11